MRLFISSIFFIIALSGLFLFENLTKSENLDGQAKIQNFIEQSSTTTTATSSPIPTRNNISPRSTPIPTIISPPPASSVPNVSTIPSATPPSIEDTTSPNQTSTPTPAITPSPLPNSAPNISVAPPLDQTSKQAPSFYTSSYKTSKYYYCDSDLQWKGIKPENLKQYSSADKLLIDYPNRKLHAPCK